MSALLDAVRELAKAAKDYNPAYAAARQASEVLLDKTFAGRAKAIVQALEADKHSHTRGPSIECLGCVLLRDLAKALGVKE